jgi:hypothetical protein
VVNLERLHLKLSSLISVRLASLIALACIAAALGGARGASASGGSGGTAMGVANGASAIGAFYIGSTDSPGDKVGDQIVFAVGTPSGSTATPTIDGAGARPNLTVPIGGFACDEKRDTGGSAGYTKCWVNVRIMSTTPGQVNWNATNQRTGGQIFGQITFLPERATVPMVRRNDARRRCRTRPSMRSWRQRSSSRTAPPA